MATAPVPGGRVAVDALPAVKRTLTRKGPAKEPMRRPGFPPRSGSSFSTASMQALRLGQSSETSA